MRSSDTEFKSDYDLITDALVHTNLEITAAQLHGKYCGMVCLGLQPVSEKNLTAKLTNANDPESKYYVNQIDSLYKISSKQIAETDFSFELLLPDDSAGITSRMVALKEWCYGFMSVIQEQAYLLARESQELLEIIDVLSEIGTVDVLSFETNEQNEKDFFNLIEFIRISILMVYNEFDIWRNQERVLH